jgi:D-alanine-D-alanine ligase
MQLTVGLTYDLQSDYLKLGFSAEQAAEFDIDETVDMLEEAIQQNGFKTYRIGNARRLVELLADGKRWDLVFNIAEGLTGRSREAQVPALLEIYNIPYTFSDPLVCALTLDKALAKRLVKAANLTTADFYVLGSIEDIGNIKIDFPLFAKPLAEGTGKGISSGSVIRSKSQLIDICSFLLEQFNQPVLIEQYLPGREFTSAVIGNDSDAFVLGVTEVEVCAEHCNTIYSYKAKKNYQEFVTYRPCLKNNPLYEDIEKLSLSCFRTLQCRDAARFDIRCDKDGKPSFMEANVLPGLHPVHSDLPIIARQQKLEYKDLIGKIIECALKRTGGK